MKKFDLEFAAHAEKSAAETAICMRTLIQEVERLTGIVSEAVRIIRQGKTQFAPNTTNSDVDLFLTRHG